MSDARADTLELGETVEPYRKVPNHFQPPLAGASIVSFAVDRWTDVPRCRHHVMSRLARTNRVLFTTAPWYVRDVLGPGDDGEGRVTRCHDTLHTYAPPRWLPCTYRFPRLDKLSLGARAVLLRRVMGRLSMRQPILYIWHPSFADVIGQFGEQLVVYHCYDEYAAFTGSDRVRVAEQEARVLDAADIVLTVSEGLFEKKRARNPNTHLVRNGVDYPLFASARDRATPVAAELAGLRRPIVGCVTRIVPDYFDAVLLHEIFSRRPDWSFVVVGPECAGSKALTALKALPNVHLVGRRDLSALPSYLKGFDACLIPYVLTENKLLADPLKLYEYLAAGKPVVSKPLPGLASFSNVVSFATTAGEWIDAIDTAIRHDSDQAVARRQQIAQQHTWDMRVDAIGRLITSALAARHGH
jgi:glycosyltransferase involved in cell wall biosynthesis